MLRHDVTLLGPFVRLEKGLSTGTLRYTKLPPLSGPSIVIPAISFSVTNGYNILRDHVLQGGDKNAFAA